MAAHVSDRQPVLATYGCVSLDRFQFGWSCMSTGEGQREGLRVRVELVGGEDILEYS